MITQSSPRRTATKAFIATLASATILLGAVTGGAALAQRPDNDHVGSSNTSHSAPAKWSYSGETGPEHWGRLSEDFGTCQFGTAQSPINITAPVGPTSAAPTADYQPVLTRIHDDGHSIEAKPAAAGSTLTVDGVKYDLEKMHFHAPAEHQLDGKTFPLELHFVHKSPGGAAVALGLLVEPGPANPGWQPFIDSMNQVSPDRATQATIPWNGMVPTDLSAFNYQGSLTTPPCGQPVNWFVARQPITMSQAQIDAFTAHYDHNNRPLQPHNGRAILTAGQ